MGETKRDRTYTVMLCIAFFLIGLVFPEGQGNLTNDKVQKFLCNQVGLNSSPNKMSFNKSKEKVITPCQTTTKSKTRSRN